ncbi:MAG TPA: hypothetical protein G4O07_04900 [Dehalococcoidia bacterium]|nr:hypothetical protein [Dehalococcoidia bacterium]
MEGKTVYFDKVGPENTEETLRITKVRAEELGIRTVVVATTVGDTAVRSVEVLEGLKVIVVTHVTGMREADVQEFTEENKKKVESKGGIVLTTGHAFTGIGGAMRKKFQMYLVGDVIANTLRVFGQGMKVVCEIALMAADSGLVRTDEDVIAIGGTGRGADTAVVLSPVNTSDFFDMKVKEILCKPHF